jgi:hypothetical protein
MRPVDDVIRDIDTVHRIIQGLKDSGCSPGSRIKNLLQGLSSSERQASAAAYQWYEDGCRSVFLQDGNSLVMKPEDLVRILRHIKTCFPEVERITSYARSDSVARISDEVLRKIADAGLNRIHIGLETASDTILEMVKKGVSKETHIKAGVKVKQAGMELSEYVLTGIGGRQFSEEHAIETADALNQINPDFIRFRTLHILESLALYETDQGHSYQRPSDLDIAKEINLLINGLENISSVVRSDHMLNLFQEVDGELPKDKDKLLSILQTFIDMTPEEQMCFQVGKRLGYLLRICDMQDPERFDKVDALCRQHGLTPANVDDRIHDMIQERMQMGLTL